MSKDDETERRALMSRPIPARPKRPSGTAALDELLGKRQQLFTDQQPEQDREQNEPKPQLDYDAFHSFRLILRTLNKYPKATQQEMISLLADLLNQ